MRGITHVMIGIGAGALIGTALELAPKDIPWFALLFGSLAPDIDEPESYISRPGTLLKPIIPRSAVKILDGVTHLVSKGLNLMFGHRGISHSLVFPIIFAAAGRGFGIESLVWFAGAYALHIIADLCTISGVPLYAPITQRVYSLKLCATGSALDTLTMSVFAGGLVAYCIRVLVATSDM